MVFLLMFGAARAQAALKIYNSTPPNGLPGDSFRRSANLCPPTRTTLGWLRGQANLVDDGSGTVTLEEMRIHTQDLVDLGPEFLEKIFGPGAFIFMDTRTTTEIVVPHVGTGDSSPGGQITWGVISGWVASSTQVCLSSPTSICNPQCHFGCPGPPFVLPSTSYDLGTWNFDAEGDYEAARFYILRTSNGGLTNRQRLLRGAFVGASVPALPLLGIALLAAGLVVIARRGRG